MQDATSITHARVLRIALPIVLSNLTIPLQGVADTAVIGQIPDATPIAAVAVGAALITAVLWIFGFLRMGTAGLTAQAQGAGNRAEVAALLTRALMIGGAGGLLLVPLLPLIAGIGFAVSPADAAVEELAAAYMQIRILSAPAAVAIYGINGWLGALENTRAMLALQLWMVSLNVALNALFVLGLGWGVEGVAVATVIADWTGLALGLWLCRPAFATPAWRDWPRVSDRARLRHMAMVNADILLRSLLLQAIMLSFIVYYSAGFGVVVLAANQVLMQFIAVMAYALDGFAFAAEALVGQAVGARRIAALRRAVALTSLWGFVTNLVFALGFALLGSAIIDAMTREPQVQDTARRFLPWIVATPVLGLPSWMLDGIFIGATRTRDMRNMMAISTLVYFAAVSALIPLWGAHGLWAALMVAYVVRAVTLAARYPALERAVRAA
ncbi:MATE family efflux transporter [Maliponia aquimaris]|uniref:DNA-damage-inducible protein F n=1 Tax=Maliponia aquimaris TaxID=1673631 RepID=A0A238KTL0_9RHOB|nr:MATE family efflux transporter [Maliponia aquimaris]SMX46129.1 DNA-damage-inducible protein F [Maliponia aquimaris]